MEHHTTQCGVNLGQLRPKTTVVYQLYDVSNDKESQMARTIISGGGANSRVVKNSASGQKIEPKARAMNVEAVGQQGASLAFARKLLEQGPGYTTAKMGGVDRPSYKGPTTA